ncbi:MAG: hypothetical protein ABR969_04240 [Sedimentisphaerales bacterium]|jgi:hypothetical protein
MKTNYQKHIKILLIIGAVVIARFLNQECLADPNTNCLVKLGSESQKIGYLVESLYWPDFDFKNAKQYISEPNSKRKTEFVRFISQMVEPNYLPQDVNEKVIFLKGWRGEESENFILQYEKPPYLIRIKNQTTTVIASRKWTSYWFTIAIQLKNKNQCVDKTDSNAIFKFTDQFLGKKINSKAQDYSSIKNMDGTKMNKPHFQKMDNGYMLAYHVGASHPDIDGVIVWTDGHIVIINLKERRKEIY